MAGGTDRTPSEHRPNESQTITLKLTALGLFLTTCFGCAAFATGQVSNNVGGIVPFLIGFVLILFFSGGCEEILAVVRERRRREPSDSRLTSLPSFGQAFFFAVAGAVLFTGTCAYTVTDDNDRLTALTAFVFGASTVAGVLGYAFMWMRASVSDLKSCPSETNE